MTTKDDGGQAFPVQENEHTHFVPGMSLRDYFAAKAMQSYIRDDGIAQYALERNIAPKDMRAKFAYDMADAMLEARKQ